MTVRINKPAINLREELADLRKPSGVAGEAMLRAETPQEQFNLIGAGRRNLILNGGMQVAQRGTSDASKTTAGYHVMDRWKSDINNVGTWTISQEADAPNGFATSLKYLCTSATSSPTSMYINQRIEGQNLQQTAKGTSDALPLTLSFWVKSNVTGVYTAEIYDADNIRHCGKAYTINQSGVWEYKTVTFPPDVIGSFDNDNNLSLYCAFWLAASESTFGSGTFTGTWSTTNQVRKAENQVNLASATNNYWQITGVQLELGKVATPFEHRSYGEELALCQRYYTQTNFNVQAYHGASTYASENIHWQQRMRATPTTTLTAGTTTNVTSTIAYDINNNGCRIEILATNNGRSFHIGGFVNADAEL